MIYRIFADESRQSKDRFMVLGGLIVEQSALPEIEATIKKFRTETGMFAELKWTKVTNQKVAEYKRLVEYLFALLNTDILHFHCITIDNHQVDHRKFNKGNKELGFYKFYYQLLLHCFGKRYCDPERNDRFITHLDHRNTSYKIGTLKNVLNNGMSSKFAIATRPFVSIEPKNSKDSELIQINDIILGAIGFQKNSYDLLPHSRKAKKDLVALIAKEAGLRNLKEDTAWANRRFTIWNFKLQK